MQAPLFPSPQDDSFDEFKGRVLSCLSAWGFNSRAVDLVLEKCSDTIEQIDIIRIYLNALSNCGKAYDPYKILHGYNNSRSLEDAVAEGCRTMLRELEIIRKDTYAAACDASWFV
jgi:hypothetical protein